MVSKVAGRDLLELSVARGTSSTMVFALASSPAAATEELSPSQWAAGAASWREQLPPWLAEMPMAHFQPLQFGL